MAPKDQASKASAAQPAAANASAGQPAAQPAAKSDSAEQHATLPLRELNKRSGQFGAWAVVVQQAQVDTYEYKWDDKPRTGKTFSCTFVSSQDPTEYCMGQMKWAKKDEQKFRTIQNKLSDGSAFIMTKVSISTDAKKQYMHAPIQTMVNVSDTIFSAVLRSKDAKECYPQPPATIADCANLTSQQFFDVTALVKSVSPSRAVKDNRVVFDAEIIDGSKSGGRVRTMPLTVWADKATSPNSAEPPVWAFLKDAAAHGLVGDSAAQPAPQPVSFFRIKGAQDDDGDFSFTTTKNTIIVEGATTSKGHRLAAEAAILLGLTDTHSFAVKKYEEAFVARDFATEPATETMCALFKPIANTVTTGVEALDDEEETFWQLNWVRVEEPPAGRTIRTNDGKRIWFPVTVRDCTGTLTLYITEPAALKLGSFDDADQFEAAFVAGKVWFPQVASVKIIRQRKTATAAQERDGQPAVQVDVRIVDAACQSLAESPTEESARLLTLLNAENTTSDIVMPAALHMLRKSPHYTLAVESIMPDIPDNLKASFLNVPSATTLFRPCSQVLALVEASKPSVLQEAGAGGYKITTSNVKDLLHDKNDDRGVQLTSFCTLENLQDFKLDPPRMQANKKQPALVLISSMLQESTAEQPASFMVDSVQLLQQTEVDAVKVCLKRMLFLTTLAGHMSSRKRDASESTTNTESPAKAAKCRVLGRHPTAAPVPEFH